MKGYGKEKYQSHQDGIGWKQKNTKIIVLDRCFIDEIVRCPRNLKTKQKIDKSNKIIKTKR